MNFRFLSLKNINIFLSACKASFGLVKESDLFDPTMLYDFTGRLTISITLFDKSKNANQVEHPFVLVRELQSQLSNL